MISLSQAWTSESLLGTFVYSVAGLGLTPGNADVFVDAVLAKVQGAGVQRAFLWVSSGMDSAALLGLTPTGNGALTPLYFQLTTKLWFVLKTPATLSLNASTVHIESAQIGYIDTCAPEGAVVTSATLALDGPGVGTIRYNAAFTGTSLLTASSWGFQFAHPGSAGPTRLWLPLAAAPAGTVPFAVTIDPSDPLNAVAIRSRMTFAEPAAQLTSSLLTRQGKPVKLVPRITGQPAGLVFTLGIGNKPVLLSPLGDFGLVADSGPDLAYLLCGLNGTEAITFLRQGDGELLRFTPYQPAYAGRYPFAAASPVSPPTDPTAPLLDSTLATSWVSIVTGKPMYVAQPKGAPLYRWTADYDTSKLLAWADQAQGLPLGVPFPLAGYGLPTEGWTAPAIADFENQVIAPFRRQLIGLQVQTDLAAAEPYTTTTPTGQIVTVNDGTWTSILLGKTANPPKPGGPPPAFPELALCFSKPKPELQQAFQTGSLFLVVANGYYLGAQHEGDGKAQPVPTFNNAVNIGGWRLEARVGSGNAYGDYRNVMIVKGRRGKLYDRAKPADSLIANPEQWTQPDFAIPSDPVRGEFTSRQRRELTVLSQWLQDYFAAVPASDPDYAKFTAIAADPNWTGTLFLRVDVTDVPADLAGIMAGIDDPAGFSAHHLGIEATAVKVTGKNPGNQGDSSMFGLIDYTDPKFTKRGPARPVRPAPATTYDFRLLTLAVSFANTAVRRFASLAQLTATTWFDMPVDHMGETGNRFSALLLTGTLQTNDGLPVYSLASTEDALFYLGNDIVRKVEITRAVMSTQSAGDRDAEDPKDAAASSWFSLAGFLDFEIVRARFPGDDSDPGEPIPLDLFSFGSPAGEDLPRSGLAFSNLGILMSFPPDSPADRVFTFDADRIQFDIATSTPREGSLFRQFALEVGGIVSGGLLTPPRRSGYLQVVTDARLTGVERGPWWGIDYVLTMGSAGHLAGQAGLNGHLLTAWSPRKPRGRAANRQDAETYQAGIGLKLPGTGGGAKLISLQSVLRLSIGQLWLRYDPAGVPRGSSPSASTGAGAFLLLLSEIALRVLGLGTLPPGSTLFYLYGDPNQTGSPSGLGWYAMYQREVAGK
ncbi:MAG TPA: hypothetical protein VFI65_13915 [Streptosporangiaceae bacterium]|nr:hypothetical protein [Streptosporangiaceae bacterium]